MAPVLLRPRTWIVPYVLLWFAVGLLPIDRTDMDLFFWPSAHEAVDGHPLLVYTPRGQDDYPNANGPVSLVPLSALGVALNAFHSFDSQPWRRSLALALFSLFLLLMSREAVRAVERIRGAALTGYVRLLAYAVFALGPPLWQSVAGYGHIEQPVELWLLLVAVRWLDEKREVRAGAAFALAILSRSSSVLLAVPLSIYSGRRGIGALVRLGVATAVTGVAVLAPFLLADPANVIHSLFTYRGNLVVGAGSIWSVAHGTSLEPVVQHWDIVPVVAGVLISNAWLATRPGGLTQARLFAAMAFTAASFTLFAKTVWPYYFVEVFIFGTVWAFGRWQVTESPVRLGLLPLAVSTFGLVGEIGSEEGLAQNLVQVEGVAMFTMIALTMLWAAWVAGEPRERKAGMVGAPAPLRR
ncbi:MAG TPA: hypothetical protein VFB69_03100 [Candidatus Dormibacteraeota bacterium]|nr:hypothetical protein [Candidatus Dormibacteraeota bacterium]